MTNPNKDGNEFPQLHVERQREGIAVVVRAAGEVDMTTAPLLKEQLEIASDQTTPDAPLVVDLRDIQFFGSLGVALLVEARARCQERGSTLRLLATGPVTRPLDVLGMQDMFPLSPTLSAAITDPCRDTDHNRNPGQ